MTKKCCLSAALWQFSVLKYYFYSPHLLTRKPDSTVTGRGPFLPTVRDLLLLEGAMKS